jgi:hypothetical protein
MFYTDYLIAMVIVTCTHTHVQVYMDWANHYLRKTGHSATLSDLKEIADGHFLPQIIQAVGKEGRGERERESIT